MTDSSNIGEFSQNEALAQCINIEDALKRLGGNANLYKTLLKSFASNNYIDVLREQVQNDNTVAAAETAHTIKGVSANLSLVKVSAASAFLEKQLKDVTAYGEAYVKLEDAMTETLGYIDVVLSNL